MKDLKMGKAALLTVITQLFLYAYAPISSIYGNPFEKYKCYVSDSGFDRQGRIIQAFFFLFKGEWGHKNNGDNSS